MSRLTRDGTAEPVSRDQILRHARGQGNVHFPCSADHEQDWQPYPVDPYSAICDDHTYIHTYTPPPPTYVHAARTTCNAYYISLFCLFFVCISLMADGPQSARLPIPPTAATLPFYPVVLTRRIFPSLPGSRLVCVCVFSSHPFWTSSSLDVPAGVTQEEGHTGFLIHLPSAVRALIFVARRIQPFLSLVDREVEFCVQTN